MASFPRPLSQKPPGPPPRGIHPICYPQKPVPAPSLPSPARTPHFARNWTRSTHLVPSALPRSTPDVPAPELPPDVGTDRNERVSEIADQVISARLRYHENALSEEKRSRKPLWNCINRYVNRVPSQSENSITLLCSHPNGLNKETWEPTIASLIERLQGELPSNIPVNEIWTWEAVNHGESAVVNDSNLGAVYDWSDNVRDILNFLVYHIPENPIHNDLKLHLTPVPEDIADSRRAHGFTSRILVGVGHSFGGCSTALAACHMPVLFSGVVLVDPIIESVETYHTSPLPYGAIKRRWRWPSRADALRFFKANPFFNAWDPAVLEIYVEHGIRPSPDGEGVQLKMNGVQEATVFADYWTANDAHRLLPDLTPRIPIHWILPDIQKTWFTPDQSNGIHAQQRAWLRPENSTNVIMPGVGHLITQEAPDQLAREMHDFLIRAFPVDAIQPVARL